MKVTIEVKGMTFDKIDKFTKAVAPDVIQKSYTAALNKTIVTIRARAVRGIGSSSGIKPLKIIRQRTRVFKAHDRRSAAGVILHTAPIPAEILAGKTGPRWTPKMKGVRAKGRFYEGAFVGTPRAGRLSNKRKRIYTRVAKTGSNRADLRAQYVHFDKQVPILEKVGRRVVDQKLESEFVKQFNWRIQKAGY